MVTRRDGHFKARKQATRPGPGSAACRPDPRGNGGGTRGRGKLCAGVRHRRGMDGVRARQRPYPLIGLGWRSGARVTTEDQFLPDTLGAEPVFYRVQFRWLHLSSFHTGKDNNGQCRLFVVVPGHVGATRHTIAPALVLASGAVHACCTMPGCETMAECRGGSDDRRRDFSNRENRASGGRLDRRIPAGTPAESLHTKIEQVANAMILVSEPCAVPPRNPFRFRPQWEDQRVRFQI